MRAVVSIFIVAVQMLLVCAQSGQSSSTRIVTHTNSRTSSSSSSMSTNTAHAISSASGERTSASLKPISTTKISNRVLTSSSPKQTITIKSLPMFPTANSAGFQGASLASYGASRASSSAISTSSSSSRVAGGVNVLPPSKIKITGPSKNGALTSASASAMSTASSSSVNVIPVAVKNARKDYLRILKTINGQSSEIKRTQTSLLQQISQWLFASPGTQQTIEDALASAVTLIETSQSYTETADKLLQSIESYGSDVPPQWMEKVKKLLNLAETTAQQAAEILAVVVRVASEVAADQAAYKAAKKQQVAATKAIMDEELNALLQQTLQVGAQASNILSQAKREWSSLLRRQIGAERSISAINRLNEVLAQVMADLSHLSPEDIETAMSDAHRAIEDVKALIYSYEVPSADIRQSVNPVQLAVFAILSRARNIAYQQTHK